MPYGKDPIDSGGGYGKDPIDQPEPQKVPPAQETTLQGFEHGFMAPFQGAAQLAGHLIPGSMRTGETPSPAEGRPEPQPTPAIGGRILGEMANPVNYLPAAGLFGKTGAAWRIGKSVLGGAGASLMQPVEPMHDYWSTKAHQAGVGAIVGGAAAPIPEIGSWAFRHFGNFLARKYPENIQNTAVQTVLKRINQDAKGGNYPTAKDAIDLVNAASFRGQPMTLTDVGGPNVKGLAGRVARSLGESKAIVRSFMTWRDEEAATRINKLIDQYVNSGPTAHNTVEALYQARSTASRPAYEKAMQPGKAYDTVRLRGFLADPTVQAGIGRGIEAQRLEALAEGKPFNPSELSVDWDDANQAWRFVKVPNMRTLDAVKRGLDAMIADARDSTTGRLTERGVMLEKVRQAYLKELDSLNPDYKAAREAWAGPTAALDALRQGQTLFQRSPEEIASEFQKLSPADREFYKIGLADSMRERVAKAAMSADEAKQIMRNDWMRQQVKPIFQTRQQYEDFVDSVMDETAMKQTQSALLAGSQTAERGMEDRFSGAEHAITGGKIAYSVAQGYWLSVAHNAWRLLRELGSKPDPVLNEHLAKILMSSPIPPKLASDLTAVGGPVLRQHPLEKVGTAIRETYPYLVPGIAGTASPQ